MVQATTGEAWLFTVAHEPHRNPEKELEHDPQSPASKLGRSSTLSPFRLPWCSGPQALFRVGMVKPLVSFQLLCMSQNMGSPNMIQGLPQETQWLLKTETAVLERVGVFQTICILKFNSQS